MNLDPQLLSQLSTSRASALKRRTPDELSAAWDAWADNIFDPWHAKTARFVELTHQAIPTISKKTAAILTDAMFAYLLLPDASDLQRFGHGVYGWTDPDKEQAA